MQHTSATVFIIDDNHALCDALRCLMESVKLGVKVFSNAQDYLNHHDPKHCGCLLVDVRMPIMSGLELLEELNKRNNHMPIIFMTAHGDVPMAVRAMKIGAIDFILKPFNTQELLEKVQKAIAYNQAQFATSSSAPFLHAFSKLTKREKEVLEMIVAGMSNKQIAFDLSISYHTVEFHRNNLMKKLQTRTIAELVKIYLLYSKNNHIVV